MDKFVVGFNEFLNEDLNYTNTDTGICKLEDRWFFYNPDDEIIYGCDEKPVEDGALFAFNPSSCTIILAGEEKQYDVNNPVCLIEYIFKGDEVHIYTENALEYLQSIGWKGSEIDAKSQPCRASLMDFFEMNEDGKRFILIYGDQMVASSFDVIEEN